jgi:Starch-binding associating with outer membrane
MKIKLLSFFILGGLLLGGCKKSWLDVNTSPNDLPVTISNYVFSNAVNTTAYNYWGDNGTGTRANELGAYFSGQWTQSSSYILNTSIFGYLYTNTDFDFWDDMYNNLEDYQYVIDNAAKDNQKFLIGPSKVMQAMVFQNLVDLYGNIPYSDALKGLNSLAPKFDDQKTVYENLIVLLDSAITNIKANAWTVQKTSDIVFAGNTTKWIKLANTLKLRILIRQSRITGRDTYITTEINKAVAEGTGFLGAGEDAAVNPGFQAQSTKQNPYYDRWGYDPAGTTRSLGRFPRATTYLFNTLVANNDTFRLKRLLYAVGGEDGSNVGVSKNPENLSNYKAVPYGAGSGFTGPSTSSLGPSMIVKGQYKPVMLMTAAESFFLQAEAKQRFPSVTLAGTAQVYYEQGVRESFRVLAVPNAVANANTLLSSGKPDADWTASTNKLQTIGTQKWIALANFNGLEAWAEYRRTGYPAIPQSQAVSDPNKRPLRLYYPSTELGSNEANVLAQGTINVFSTRLFWDVD